MIRLQFFGMHVGLALAAIGSIALVSTQSAHAAPLTSTVSKVGTALTDTLTGSKSSTDTTNTSDTTKPSSTPVKSVTDTVTTTQPENTVQPVGQAVTQTQASNTAQASEQSGTNAATASSMSAAPIYSAMLPSRPYINSNVSYAGIATANAQALNDTRAASYQTNQLDSQTASTLYQIAGIVALIGVLLYAYVTRPNIRLPFHRAPHPVSH